MHRLFLLLALICSYKVNSQAINCSNAEIASEGDNFSPYAPYWFAYEATEDSYITISSFGKTEIPTTLNVYTECLGQDIDLKINEFYIAQDDKSFPLKLGESVKFKWEAYDSNEGFDWELIAEPIQSVSETDSLALVDLYNNTNGDDWFRNTYWLKDNVQTWQGITVENNRVTEVYLERNNLKGSLTASIGELSALKKLNISRNEFNGNLPKELGNLHGLEELILSGNQFSGAVPSELSNLSKLTHLFLSGNNFHSLPDLSSFQFERLRLRNNIFDFEDLEPYRDILNSLDDIQRIPADLSANIPSGTNYTLKYQIGGSANNYQWFKNNEPIPEANTNAYQILDASLDDIGVYRLEVSSDLMHERLRLISPENQITVDGYKFGDICSLADSLSLGKHKMNEERFWYQLNNEEDHDVVATIDAYTNEFKNSKITVVDECEGNIITESEGYRDRKTAFATFIIPAGETYYLLLENLGIKGDLDFQFSTKKLEYVNELDSLALVDFYDATFGEAWYSNNNWLKGPVASWEGIKVEEGRVNAIELAYNHLTGTLNPSLNNLTELESLEIQHNSIEGSIPKDIRKLLKLRHLRLNDNKLEGTIPEDLERLWRLNEVNFSNNNLTGIDADLTEERYSEFNIKGNRFEFDDLELNRRQFTDYDEMQPFSEIKAVGISIGDDIVLAANTGGIRNSYQWYLDGVEIPNAKDETLILENITNEDLGRYSVKVNTIYLHRLTLEREPIILYEIGNEQGDHCGDPLSVEWYNVTNFNPTWYSYSTFEDRELILESDCCDNTRVEVYDACGGNLIASSSSSENGDEFASLRFKAMKNVEYYFLWMNKEDREVHWYMEELPSVSVLESDSLALVDLFRSTQGQDWFSQTYTTKHWLKGPVSTWYGITTTANRVTEIRLSTNALKGEIPESIGDLTALEVLYLQGHSNDLVGDLPQSISKLENLLSFTVTGNHISGGLSVLENLENLRYIEIIDNDFSELLDVSNLTKLYRLDISGNKLEFDDMESIVEKINKNEHQQKFGEYQMIRADFGEKRTIGFEVGGDNNQYQWQKDGLDLEGENENYLVLDNIMPNDSGEYQLLVENTTVPGLILESEFIHIDVLGRGKLAQTISFDPLSDKTFGDENFILNATASSGLLISYQSSDPAIASITEDSILINGAGSVTITANQVGNDVYQSAAPVQQELIINKANQEIEFEPLISKVFGDSLFTLHAIASSGLAIEYLSSDTTVASIDGDKIEIMGAGSAIITATQTGNENFNAASNVQQELSIEKADQVISIVPISNVGITTNSLEISASTNSKLPLEYSLEGPAEIFGSTIMFTGNTGTIKVIVKQLGNSNFNMAMDSISFEVHDDRQSQEIIFTSIEDKATDSEPFNIEAHSTSELALNYQIINGPATINENVITLEGVEGVVEILIEQPGNNRFKAADTTFTFQVVSFCEIFSAQIVQTKRVSCYGEDDGVLDVEVEGGVPPYSYIWSNGFDNAHAEDLNSGLYEVTITDDSNCSITIETRLYQPNPIQVKADIMASTGADGNGLISLAVSEGNPPYKYLWNTGDTLSTIENLIPGIYDVLITDSNGCTNEKVYSLGGVTSNESKEMEFFLNIYPNPADDFVNIRSSKISTIMLFDAFGKLIREEQISSPNFILNVEDLTSGVYFIKGDLGNYHRFVKN